MATSNNMQCTQVWYHTTCIVYLSHLHSYTSFSIVSSYACIKFTGHIYISPLWSHSSHYFTHLTAVWGLFRSCDHYRQWLSVAMPNWRQRETPGGITYIYQSYCVLIAWVYPQAISDKTWRIRDLRDTDISSQNEDLFKVVRLTIYAYDEAITWCVIKKLDQHLVAGLNPSHVLTTKTEGCTYIDSHLNFRARNLIQLEACNSKISL